MGENLILLKGLTMSLLLRIQFYKSHFLEIDEKEMNNVNKEVRERINMLNFRCRFFSMNEGLFMAMT
jgi:hypothetical protein